MPTCIYCGKIFSTSGGEHILQNSLGARWTSPVIVCNREQKQFGETIDSELANRLKTFRNLFDHETGRGNPPPILTNLPTLAGKQVALGPGGVLKLNQPEVSVEPRPDGSKDVSVAMRNDRDIGWILHLIRKQIPNAKIDEELMQQLSVRTTKEAQDVVKLELQLGGQEFLRAAVKSVFNLAAVSEVSVLDPCFNRVREFVRDGTVISDDFVRFVVAHSFAPITRFSPVDHFVGVISRNHSVQAFLQYYGALQYVIRLSDNYHGPPLHFGYLVNPQRNSDPAETRSPEFDATLLPEFLVQPEAPTEEAMTWMKTKLGPIIAFHLKSGRKQRIARIVDAALAAHSGKQFTPELIRKLAEKIAYAFRGLDRPDRRMSSSPGANPPL